MRETDQKSRTMVPNWQAKEHLDLLMKHPIVNFADVSRASGIPFEAIARLAKSNPGNPMRKAYADRLLEITPRDVLNPDSCTFVDGSSTKARIEFLMEEKGYTITAIAEAAGMTRQGLASVRSGGKVEASTAMRVHQAYEKLVRRQPLHDVRSVDSTRTRRMIQALRAQGWSIGDIAECAGVERETISKFRPNIYRATEIAVVQAYDSMRLCQPSGRLTKGSAALREMIRVRHQEGYAPWSLWTEKTIGDVMAKPEREMLRDLRDPQWRAAIKARYKTPGAI